MMADLKRWIAASLVIAMACLALAGAALASSAPAGENVPASDPGIAVLRQLLAQPEDQIDLARAKVTLDYLVDPSVNIEPTLLELDHWAALVRARTRPGASNRERTETLLSTLYEPGPWNGNKPFTYDYSDPYGRNLHNALLSTYFSRREGQCVIMPIAVVLLGQKLGLPMTMTTAPYHLIVKYGDEEQGAWTNLDATSGLFHADSGYEAALQIPGKALENGIYLRPHSRRESVALFATAVLIPHYLKQEKFDLALQATDLILEANPIEVQAMILKGEAYVAIVDTRFRSKYPDPNQIPDALRPQFIAYSKKIVEWRTKAADLGYKEWTKEDWDRYLALFSKGKSEKEGHD